MFNSEVMNLLKCIMCEYFNVYGFLPGYGYSWNGRQLKAKLFKSVAVSSTILHGDCYSMQPTGKLHSIHISLLWKAKNRYVFVENMPKATIAKAVERSLEEVLYEMTLQYPLIFSEDYNNFMKDLSVYIPRIGNSMYRMTQTLTSSSRQKCFEKSLINIHALTKQAENNMTEDELITTLYENAKAGYLSSLPKRKRADRRLTTSSQTSNCCERSRKPFAKGIGLSDIEDLFQQPSVPPIRQEMQGKVSETVTTFTNNAFDDSI